MKKYILFLFLVAAIGAKSQTQVTSKALGDKIWLMPGAYEITPFTVNIKGDTVRSISYSTIFQRDTTQSANITVSAYNKSGLNIMTVVLSIPGNAYKKWATLINPIDSYISSQFPKVVKQ